MNNQSNQFLIGTVEEGITKNTKPWATPKDSWEELVNMYQFRGRVVKKKPYSQIGQLSFVEVDQVVGASANPFNGNLFTSHVPVLANVKIVPRSITITVSGGANYTLAEDENNPGTIKFVSGANVPAFTSGTINYLTGALVLNFAGAPPAGNVLVSYSYAYGLPVMGCRTRVLFELNEQDTVCFDNRFAYRYDGTNDEFIPLPSIMPTEWSGTNSNFFFTTNYAGAFWATNNKVGLHGWNVTAFAGAAGAGPTATVNVTSAGNTAQVGDFVYFLNLDPALANNSRVLAQVTVAGDPVYTVIAVGFPAIPTTLATTFTWTNGATTTGIGLDSAQSIAGQDGIRYYGSLSTGTGWANYNPPVDLNNALVGALLIFPYRGYLVFLNTWEGNEQAGSVFNYGNRARWTQIGTPYYSSPTPQSPSIQGFAIDAVRDDLFGKGGANDAPTQEVIVGACFIRDILIVFFERSCWRLRFVNNAQNPFVWERINVELGCDSTFSVIPFDQGGMAVGERGIIIANANEVARIDEKIPETVFEIRINNQGLQRIHGIRTFQSKLNYWTYPSDSNPLGVYPDQVLVYNYDARTWATFDDCFTCFGYFYVFSGGTWADLTSPWSEYNQITFADGSTGEGSENIIAGNQQGFILNLDTSGINKQPNANFQNGASLWIDDISVANPGVFTSTDNNLPNESWIVLTGVAGTTSADGVSLNGRSFKVVNPDADANDFTLLEFEPYNAGSATGLSFIFQLSPPLVPIYPGSVKINVNPYDYADTSADGILYINGLAGGTIDYVTGVITLNFPVPIAATDVIIRVVSQNPAQQLIPVETIGTYTGGGYISKTSNFIATSKIFNFLGQDKRSRLSRIDFYTNKSENGEFQADILADSSNWIVNSPLSDNPRSNIVKTSVTQNQVGFGDQTMYRLYSNAVAQTLQFSFHLNDGQMATPLIATSDLELLALNVSLRPGGRLV